MRKLILLTGLLAAGAAHAADNGIYVGASLGQATVQDSGEFIEDLETVRADFDGDDLGFKVLIGVRPLDWLGVEGAYVNFGEQEETINYTLQSQPGARETTFQFEGYALAGFLVGYLPIGPVDIFGKAGLVSWDSKSRRDEDEWLDEDGEDLAYGVGVQFRLLSLGLRAEYEVFDIDGLDDANLLSIGVTYTFL